MLAINNHTCEPSVQLPQIQLRLPFIMCKNVQRGVETPLLLREAPSLRRQSTSKLGCDKGQMKESVQHESDECLGVRFRGSGKRFRERIVSEDAEEGLASENGEEEKGLLDLPK